jgi:hypothetical protein
MTFERGVGPQPRKENLPVRAGAGMGGSILTLSLLLTAVVSIAVDFNETHLFNPAWPPHAIFHDAAMLNVLTGFCVLAFWMLWRKTSEPEVAALVAWLAPIIFWSAFFWIPFVIPGASLQALPGAPPSIGGVTILPNVVIAVFLTTLSTAGLALWIRGSRRSAGG